jgi:CHAD domain-containing protein
VRDLVRAALLNATRQLTAHDPALRLTDDTEAVHKARVATRRLRSDLRTLRPIVDQHRTEPLRSELRWLGGVLGCVRDADVLLAELEQKIEELPDEQRIAAKRLLQRLRDTRARDQAALRAALDSHRYARLLDWLVNAAADPPLGRVKPKTPAASIADDLAATASKRFRKHVEQLPDQPIDPDLHEARKRAKQARYAHELLAPIIGKRAATTAKRFESVQELLGDHQDAVVASQWLADAARERRDLGIAFAAGEVAGLYLVDRQRARAEWPKARDRALQA